MLLQTPVGPVMERDDVTLHCKRNYSGPSSADFFKHTLLVGTSSAGHMTIRNFSKSDESAYKCRDSQHRESPPTWLQMHGELLLFLKILSSCLRIILELRTNDVERNVQGQNHQREKSVMRIHIFESATLMVDRVLLCVLRFFESRLADRQTQLRSGI